jgi:tRNA (guanine37-N1)-methyltransferase
VRIDAVSLFPDLVAKIAEHGIVRRAVERGLLELTVWNPRDYATDRHRTVDDRPYGGGPGMLMRVEPLRTAIRAARAACEIPARVLFMSPQGRRLDQAAVRRLAGEERLVLISGRYEGVDERLIELEVDEEWSIGDYVLSGGELPAMVLIDAVTRLLPGALGDEDSAEQDSFSEGLLDCPQYTRPERVEDKAVPPVLLGGNHAEIRRWRRKQALGRTWQRRPDLLEGRVLSEDDKALLAEYLREQQVSE